MKKKICSPEHRGTEKEVSIASGVGLPELELLARKMTLAMIGEGGARREAIALDALQSVARRCANLAMERCRILNGDAVAQILAARPEMARITETKADQCEWIAGRILREFGLK